MAESKLSKLADELDDADEITETHIHVHGAAQVEADATGKVKAVSIPDADDRPTPTDPPRKPKNDPPESTFHKLKLFDPARVKTVPGAIAFVALVVAVVVLVIFGPEWVRGVVHP